MKASPFLWGFLIVQAAVLGLWVPVLLSAFSSDELVSSTVQIWSRSGEAQEAARPFRPSGGLLTATLFSLGSCAALFVGRNDFRAGMPARSLVYLAIALVTGAAGIAFIAAEWTNAVMFPVGSLNVAILYMATRTWMMQVFLAYLILLIYAALVALGLATRERSFGWELAVTNWWICAGVWVALYAFAYLIPPMLTGP